MALQSKLFRNDHRLEACAASDPSHVAEGSVGEHVSKVQTALMLLDDARIDSAELHAKRYGWSTAAAVLGYKRKRDIVNRTYQTQADNIVGKMTIATLDAEMLRRERHTRVTVETIACGIRDPNRVA